MKKLTLLGIVAAAVGAQAQVFYKNGDPNQLDGQEMTLWMETEDFIIQQDTHWNDLQFWTMEYEDAFYDGTLSVALYDDNVGKPGSIIAQWSLTDGVDYSKNFLQNIYWGPYIRHEYRYDVQINGYLLSANIQYHLGLHMNRTNKYATRDNIFWESTNDHGSMNSWHSQGGPNGPWYTSAYDLAFNLTGTPVPEPLTAVSLGGLLLAAAARCRLRKSA